MLHNNFEDPESTTPTGQYSLDPAAAFLEARQVYKDFEVPGGTIRVDTRIKVSRSPWSVRSVVLENDTEIQEGPFAPIQQEFDAGTVDPEGLDDIRLDFARKALAGHLARCKQVERALAGKTPGSGKGKGAVIAVVLALVLAVGGAAGYIFWTQHKKRSSGDQVKTPASVPAPSAAPIPTPGSKAPTPESTPPVVTDAKPIIIKAIPPKPLSEPTPAPQSPKPALRPPAQTAVKPSVKIPGRTTPNAQKEAPTQKAEVREVPAHPSTPAVSEKELIAQVQPSNYRLGRLQPGGDVYVDNLASFAAVPEDLRNLRCIKTAYDDRTAKSSLTFQLTSDAKVYVAHDQRIRKKPSWLQAFSPTGKSVSLLQRGEETESLVFDLFVRTYPAGSVTLGTNTEWSGLTRLIRDTVPKKLAMYVVCVDGS